MKALDDLHAILYSDGHAYFDILMHAVDCIIYNRCMETYRLMSTVLYPSLGYLTV